MTLRELAKLANVSVSTASKAFSNAPDINPETRRHILDIAKRTGCYGKYCKEKYEKKIIAIICPEVNSAFYTYYVEKLQALIEDADCIASISVYHFDTGKQIELIDYYASHLQVDGIFVFALSAPLKRGYEIPIVSLLSSSDPSSDAVCVDMYPPMCEAVEHLKLMGHRNIAFFSESLTRSKEVLFADAMKAAGLEPGTTLTGVLRFEQAGCDCAQRLIAAGNLPTAVICAYDYIASGAIKHFKNNGIRVPEDISVIGIDNIHSAPYMSESLTSIDTNRDEVCTIAWELMQKKLQNRFFRLRQHIHLSGRLIVRDTTAPPRHTQV